jgi:ribosomal protein L11 methyltransferase
VEGGRPELLPLAAEALVELGASSVQEEGGALLTWLPIGGDPQPLAALAEEAVTRVLGGEAVRVRWEVREGEDWLAGWRRGLEPRRVSPRLVVRPTWADYRPGPGERVVEIDPQMAFGTGEHATTRGCLRLLDASVREGDRVLDVGSGSAVLAIAAALLGASEVVAVEHDPDANLNARENLERNGVAGRVRLVERLADPAWIAGAGRFDLILANILSGVIIPLLPSLHAALGARPEGRLIVSGILRTEAERVRGAARGAGFAVEAVDEEEEWWSALLRPQGG